MLGESELLIASLGKCLCTLLRYKGFHACINKLLIITILNNLYRQQKQHAQGAWFNIDVSFATLYPCMSLWVPDK